MKLPGSTVSPFGIFCFWLLWLAFFPPGASAEEVILRVEARPPYQWLHKGLLFFRYYQIKSAGQFMYCGADEHLVPVSDIQAFSKMMTEELDTPHAAEEFIRASLASVLPQFIGVRDAVLIDKEYLDQRREVPDPFWENASLADRRRSLEILNKYAYKGAQIGGKDWKVTMYVSKRDGSVEMWEMRGDIHPWSMQDFKKAIVEKSGSVVWMPSPPG